MIKSILCGITGLILISSGCHQGANQGHTSTTDSIEIDHKRIYAYSKYFTENNSGMDTTYYKIDFPYTNDSLVNQQILLALDATSIENLEATTEAFIAEYDTFVEEANDPELIRPWYRQTDATIEQLSEDLISIKTKNDEYTGGAHGNHYTLFFNYERQDTSRIRLNDVIDPEKNEDFKKLAEKFFRKSEGIGEDSPFGKEYFFENDIFVLADNFTFTPTGLMFLYNIYEIKPYSEGLTEFEIPYKDLGPLLSVKGKRYFSHIIK